MKPDWDRLERLRNQGEPQTEVHSPPSCLPTTPENLPELFQMLRVQQVQLEMQNDELRQSEQTLGEACDHYTQMYDFTPSGYVTLTPEGMIEEANLRFCTMVGVHRKLVLKRPLADFVAPLDHERLCRHCADAFDVRTTQTCKLRLLPRTGLTLIVHVESMPMMDRTQPIIHIQMAMLDITLMEQAEQKVLASQRQMQQTAARLMTAQDEKRRRITKTLHDDYCQRLTGLILEVGVLQKRQPNSWTHPRQHLQPVKDRLNTLLADLRSLSQDLHPDQVTSVALEQALQGYVADYRKRTSIEATFHGPSRPLDFPATMKTSLYRIVQESLNNIHKHAEARQVSVSIDSVSNGIELLIKDDGRGFDPETVPGTHHLGLTSMRERAEHLGGRLTIISKPAGGTTLSFFIPNL